MASVAGVRVHTDSTALDSSSRSVARASWVSTMGVARAMASATETPANPRRSAERAVSTRTSTRVSKGVNAIPTGTGPDVLTWGSWQTPAW